MAHPNSLGRTTMTVALVLLIPILIFGSIASLVPSTVKPAEAQAQLPVAERNWERKNHDGSASNSNPQKQITKDNIQFLELKWIYPVPDSGAARATLIGVTLAAGGSEGGETPPLVVDGINYMMTNFRQISAINAKTGKTLWVYRHTANITKDTAGLPVVPGAGQHVHGINYFDGKIWFYSWGCKVMAVDAITGKLAYELGPICKDIPGNQLDPVDKRPGGEGRYKNDCSTMIPQFYPPKRVLIVNCAGTEGGDGGRSFVAGYNIDTKQLLWRVFYAPPITPPDPDWATRECSKGWFLGGDFKQIASGSTAGWGDNGPYNREKKNIYTMKSWSCEEVRQKCPQCLQNDWIPGKPNNYITGSPWDGKHAGGSEVSNVWGEMPYDAETDMLYFGTAQPAPDWNSTFRPGPNLYSDSIMGVNAVTGELKWWVQTWAHDDIDVDCNLNTLFGKVGSRKVVLKTCKSGISLGMDAATGKPLWIFDPFSLPDGLVKRPENFGCSAPADPTNLGMLLCLNQWCDPVVGDYATLKKSCVNVGHHNRYLMESDMAFDGKTFYSSVMTGPNYIAKAVNLLGNPSGGSGSGSGVAFPVNWDQIDQQLGKNYARNSTISAIDAVSGQVKWRWFRDESHRGGVVVSGGVVYTNDHRGWFTMLDAETGKELGRKNIGSALTSQVTIGADSDQKMKIFAIFGGANHGVHGTRGVGGSPMIPGAVLAYGLPDTLPQPQVITKEVIKEVSKEVIKEVPKEITKTVTVETISPVSYAAIGLAVVIAVVGAIMMSRARKKA